MWRAFGWAGLTSEAVAGRFMKATGSRADIAHPDGLVGLPAPGPGPRRSPFGGGLPTFPDSDDRRVDGEQADQQSGEQILPEPGLAQHSVSSGCYSRRDRVSQTVELNRLNRLNAR